MGSAVFSPATGADDGFWEGSYFYPAGYAYLPAGSAASSFFRVPLTIPSGAHIVSAIPTWTSATSPNVTFTVKCAFVQADDPAAPTGATFGSLAIGATSAEFSLSGVTLSAEQAITGPDVSAALQEIVDRPGYAPGNHAVLVVQGVSGSRGAEIYTYDQSPAKTMRLAVSWATVVNVPAGIMTLSAPAPVVLLADVPAAGMAFSGLSPKINRAEVSAGGIALSGLAPTIVLAEVPAALAAFSGLAPTVRIVRDVLATYCIPLGHDFTTIYFAPGFSRDSIGRLSIAGWVPVEYWAIRAIPAVIRRDIVGRQAILDHNPVSRECIARLAIRGDQRTIFRRYPT